MFFTLQAQTNTPYHIFCASAVYFIIVFLFSDTSTEEEKKYITYLLAAADQRWNADLLFWDFFSACLHTACPFFFHFDVVVEISNLVISNLDAHLIFMMRATATTILKAATYIGRRANRRVPVGYMGLIVEVVDDFTEEQGLTRLYLLIIRFTLLYKHEGAGGTEI
ncbi:hypothetical protein ACJX0J_040486 [Zea mays]